MNHLRSAALAALGLIVLAGCQKATEDTSADEAIVRASAPAWGNAYNAADADKMAAMYWEDAVLFPPGAPPATGRAAICDFLASDSGATKAAGVTMNIAPGSTIDVSGDLAYEAGTFTATNAAGETVDSGKFIGVFQKRDGKWLYVRDTWNSDKAPPSPSQPSMDPAAKPAAQ